MSTRPTALLVTPVFPDPAGGGPAQRAYQWVHHLGATHDVDVLVVHRRALAGGQPPRTPLPAASVRELTATPTRARYWRSAAAALLARAAGRRRFAFVGWGREWAFVTPAARRQLAEWYPRRAWSRVVAFRLQAIDYVEEWVAAGLDAAAVQVDFDDVESLTRRSIARGLARHRRWPEALLTWLDAAQAARVEARVIARFPRVAISSPSDRSGFELRFPAAAIDVIPNRLLRLPPAAAGRGDPRRIVFVGTLGFFPNQEAVRFLAGEVLPALRATDARWRLTVAGYAAPGWLARKLRSIAGVDVQENAPDVGELYRAAGLAAAPLFSGGGTKLKVIEGLAHGRPLVATEHAVRGLSLRPSIDFWPAETAGEWVEAMVRIAKDDTLARALGASGRAAVCQQYVYGP